ncbi:MAG: TonB-dependent receptor [Thermoanaerobaculia bacterium]|nr:TonB-dependent receptor [Thermoanaerobaculia bacterium]
MSSFSPPLDRRRGRPRPRSPRTVAPLLPLLFLLLLPSPGTGEEAGAVSGRVITADGEPVTDAVVTAAASQSWAETDADGRFLLAPVPPGEQLLEITSTLHGRSVERVQVPAGDTVQVELVVLRRVHAERIVVTASPDARGELDLAAPVSVLEGRELALEVQATLGESLAREPGVSSSYFAPGASRPVIRGLGGDRIKMMENGLDTLDASSTSPDHAVATDPLLAERVEVVRGPATLLYGSNAIGGVVNVLDGRIPDAPRAGGLTGTADLRVGTAADERAAAVSLDGGGGNWAWHADLLTRETGDVEIPGRASVEPGDEGSSPEGVLPNSDLRSRSGGVGASYFFGDRGYLGVSVRGLDTEYGVPGSGHGHGEDEEEPGVEEGVRIDLEQRRLDFEGSFDRPFEGIETARLRLGVVDYEHAEIEGGGEVGTRFFNDAWEGRLALLQRRRGPHSGSFGLQVRSRELEAVGEEAFISPAQSRNLGLFTFQELDRGRVRYQLGLRYEVQETAVRAPGLPDRDFDALSASLGLVWQPAPAYSLGASLARSVKMPNGEELYSNGPHFATSAFEIGDPALREETSVGVDVTLRKVEGRVTGALNLFANDLSGFIFQAFTGAEEDGLPVLLWSQADAAFRGAELDLSILLAQSDHASWDLDLLWDVVRAELDDGGDLPRIPPQRFGAGLHYRGDRLAAGADVKLVDDQRRVAPDETPTAGYTLVNANLSYRFVFDTYFLDLIIKGTTLTDREARVHTSFVKDDVPLPGRNLSLIARFGF